MGNIMAQRSYQVSKGGLCVEGLHKHCRFGYDVRTMKDSEHMINVVESVVVDLIEITDFSNKLLEFGFVDIHFWESFNKQLIRENPRWFRIILKDVEFKLVEVLDCLQWPVIYMEYVLVVIITLIILNRKRCLKCSFVLIFHTALLT